MIHDTRHMIKQIAKLNYLRIAPRKVRLVADLLSGLSANEAEAQLLLLRKRAVPPILKLLRSAVANAKNNRKLDAEKLYIESVRVDQGPMLKRYLPRARGSASPIQKKMSHVTLVLTEKTELKAPRFKIVVPKKAKLPPGMSKKSSAKREKPQTEKKEATKQQKPGFFKRIFSRKAGFAK